MNKAGDILGVNKRHYSMQGEFCLRPKCEHLSYGFDTWCKFPPPTLAVLVAGDIGDYACYVGHGTTDWVSRNGDKVSFEEACVHFPGNQLDRKKYRD